MILRLTDGTTTVNLTGGDITLAEPFAPVSPDISPTEFLVETLRDGGELFELTRRNVVESADVTITGANAAAVQGDINDIEALFIQAEHHQRRGLGAKVWIEYRPGDSGDIYRSEILYGKVEISRDAARVAHWAHAAVQAHVVWLRRFYWEGPEDEVWLTNNHGSQKGGITVYNHDDAGHDNQVLIGTTSIVGVLPSPARIEMTNTYNDSARDYTIWIGHNAFSDPSTFLHILEAENAAAKGTDQSDSDSSNGYYNAKTWSGDTETLLWRWVLSSGLLNDAKGNYFRLLGRLCGTIPADVKFVPKITFPSGTPLTVVAEGQEITIGANEIQDFGVMQIPPWLAGETSFYPVDLCLYGRKTGGATVNLDFVQLTTLDGYRVLQPRGYGAAYGVRIVDDGIAGTLWTDGWGAGGKTGHYIGTGEPIHLWPGKAQKLYFLVMNNTGDSEIDRTHTVRVYYRPRRLTV